MAQALELTGQKFNRLTAIKKVKSKGRKTYWLCQCDCGEFKEVQTSHLTGGYIKTCGKCDLCMEEVEEKTCLICGKSFLPIAKGYGRKYCFECSPSYEKGNNQERGIAITALRQALKRELVRYKGGKCEVCGYDKNIQSLQFHHRNPKEKDFTISAQMGPSTFNIEEYKKEVDKCDLVCANCHAEIHSN